MCVSIALSALCCAGSAFCKNCCSCCKSCCGTSMKEQIRIAYIIFNIIFWLFVIFVLYWLQSIIEPFEDYISCPEASGGDKTCLGISAVYRMSFTLAIMYLVIMICMLCKNEFSKALNEGMWCFKITYIIFAFFGFMFIENSFFDAYRDISKVISIFYIVFQSVIFIDIFYIWGFKWFNMYAEGRKSMGYVLIITSIIMFIGLIIFNVFNIIWFKGCAFNLTVSVVNIVLIVFIIVIQIIKTGSLIATLATSLYMTYLTFSAQLSGPKESCSELYFNEFALYIELGIAFFFTICMLFYLTFAKKEDSSAVTLIPGNILTSKKDNAQEEREEQQEREQLQKKTQKDEEKGENKNNDKPQNIEITVVQEDKALKSYQSNAFIFFHFIMLLTSIYSAMLITNWGSPPVESQVRDAYKPSEFSYWAKIITSWFSAVVYIYTIFRKQIIDKNEQGQKYEVPGQPVTIKTK